MRKTKHKKTPVWPILAMLIIGIAFFVIHLSGKETNFNIIPSDHFSLVKYDYSKLTDNKFIHYEDDNYTSLAGIDVSEFNKDIDWPKVKKEGIDFAFIRIGWRGYMEGVLHTDDYFKKNYKEARENGILTGVYFFSQAINEKEAIEEADYVLDILGNDHLDLPIVYDYETIGYDTARTDDLSKEERTAIAEAFLKRISEKRPAMLYLNLDWMINYYDMERFSSYPLWFAQYDSLPNATYDFNIWQYSEQGNVDGIQTPCDLNIMFVPKS